MKVLGIMGSPRIKGNTDLLLDEALNGAQGEGAEIEKIVVDKLKIAYPNQDAVSIMDEMDENSIDQMPVVSDGRVIGLVARDNLIGFLRTRSELRL